VKCDEMRNGGEWTASTFAPLPVSAARPSHDIVSEKPSSAATRSPHAACRPYRGNDVMKRRICRRAHSAQSIICAPRAMAYMTCASDIHDRSGPRAHTYNHQGAQQWKA
jgi:hypothetical protein